MSKLQDVKFQGISTFQLPFPKQLVIELTSNIGFDTLNYIIKSENEDTQNVPQNEGIVFILRGQSFLICGHVYL